jgi:hypothetical protein
MLWILLPLLILAGISIYFAVLLIRGAVILTALSYLLAKWGLSFYGRGPEVIVGEPLSDEFKQTHGQVAPNMWWDRNRVVFEFGGKSYSCRTLKDAMNRHGDLMAASFGRPDLVRR